MNQFPVVTIGIPTYNRADRYLPETLASARSQVYPHVDILIADNSEEDDTERLISSLDDPRIRYQRHPENIGWRQNHDFLLAEARGDYFLLLSDDDVLDDDFVAVCVDAALRHGNAAYVRSGTRQVDAEGSIMWEWENRTGDRQHSEALFAWFRDECRWFPQSTLFRLDRLREVGGWPEAYGVTLDMVAAIRIAMRWEGANVPDVKVSFRKHAGTITDLVGPYAWLEECTRMLDEAVGLAPAGVTKQLRREGSGFFSRLCYRRVARVSDPAARRRAILAVWRAFGIANAPPELRRAVLRIASLPRRALRTVRRRLTKG